MDVDAELPDEPQCSQASPMDVDCVFCDRLHGRDWWPEVMVTRWTTAALAKHQRTPGSLIVIPRRHATSLADLDTMESADFHRVLERVTKAVVAAFEPDALYRWQGGRIPLPHVHARVSPRRADQEYTFVPNTQLSATPIGELSHIAARLKAVL